MSIIQDLNDRRKERLARLGAITNDETQQIAAVTEPVKLVTGPLAINWIQKIVAKHFDVSLAEMTSPHRTQRVAIPRMVAVFLVKEFTNKKSLPEIGRHFGGRDHTTILHAIRRIADLIKTDPLLADEVEQLRDKIKNGCPDDNILQAAVEQATRNAWMVAKELEGYRRHVGARRYLAEKACTDDVEMARDFLSRLLDDMRGVK